MTNQETIKKAEALISAGETEDAKDLLLEKGYIEKLDSEIQNAFLRLIPESKELEKEKNESLKRLFDKDAKTRIEAANYIHRQALKSNYTEIEAWQKDPRTIDVLFDALNDDEPKVVAETTGALGAIARRYFRSLKIYEKLLEMLRSEDKETVYYAAMHLDNYRIDGKWENLIAVLKDKPTLKIAQGVLKNINRLSEISESRKTILKNDLQEIFENSKNEKLKAEIKQGTETLERFF